MYLPHCALLMLLNAAPSNSKTPYRRASLRLLFPDGASGRVVAEVTNPRLSPALLERLRGVVEKAGAQGGGGACCSFYNRVLVVCAGSLRLLERHSSARVVRCSCVFPSSS